jgi:hypothetical protein
MPARSAAAITISPLQASTGRPSTVMVTVSACWSVRLMPLPPR